MAATPEDVADPEPFSPSVFLDLPPTPQLHIVGNGDGDGEDLASSDDLVLPFISRMLMEEETDDSVFYQQYPDHPALLQAQQPFAQILSSSSSAATISSHASAAANSSVFGLATTNSNSIRCSLAAINTLSSASSGTPAFTNATWPYDPVELSQSQLLLCRTRSDTGGGLDGFSGTGGDANAFSFNGGDMAIQNSSFLDGNGTTTVRTGDGDGEGVTMDMLNLAFLKGMEEANKFLPTTTTIALDTTSQENLPRDGMLPGGFSLFNSVKTKSSVVDGIGTGMWRFFQEISGNDGRGRGCKNQHNWDDLDVETGRRSKLIAPEPEETGKRVDEVFLKGFELVMEKLHGLNVFTGSVPEVKVNSALAKHSANEAVDLRTLLIHCAEAVSTYNRLSAIDLLRQIKRRSSPGGDASQRLAHCFANALEVRLAGTGSHMLKTLVAKRTSGADFLKAYKLYLEVCPFKTMAFKFSHMAISKAIAGKKKVHIVDYGDHHGFHWTPLLNHWATQEGGPPEVRITSIDFPQPGFRPTTRIEETGRRLSNFARQCGVPFKFHSIVTSKWEMVCANDINIEPDEVLVINGLFHFGKLMDEGVHIDSPSPRDMVLSNIQKMRPDVFILCVENSSYNAPFFVTRFREVLFYYYAMFDIMDSTTPRDNHERMLVEQDILGCCALNAIACEGSDRVERPETYKQWQVRNNRAGLRQLPLNPYAVKYLSKKVKEGYHKDFVVDVDQQWLLQGWKGRIHYAMSTWVGDDAIS